MGSARSHAAALLVACLAALVFAAPSWADEATSRERAIELFEQGELDKDVAVGWTGSVDGCEVGSESQASIDATFRTINAARELAGIEPVDPDATMNRNALAAALIFEAAGSDAIAHEVDESWECWTPEGEDGAAHSNLSGYGPSGSDGIWSYLDEGPDFGHRLTVLDPGTFDMGTASTGSVNVNYVIGGYRGGERINEMADDSAVAWPPSGWFPAAWLPSEDESPAPPRESWFSITLGNAETQERISARNARISVEVDDRPVVVEEVDRGLDANVAGIGKPIGFKPLLPAAIRYDEHTIDVEVTGVTLGGQAFAVDPYTVKTFGPPAPSPPDTGCKDAQTKLAAAKRRLAQAKRSGRKAKIQRARKGVARAKAAVAAAC